MARKKYKRYDLSKKSLAIYLVRECGFSKAQVARKIGCSAQSVGAWVKRWQDIEERERVVNWRRVCNVDESLRKPTEEPVATVSTSDLAKFDTVSGSIYFSAQYYPGMTLMLKDTPTKAVVSILSKLGEDGVAALDVTKA